MDTQSNYRNDEEAAVAAFAAVNRDLSRGLTAQSLAADVAKHPDSAFPFSGDHLGTHSERETLASGDPGDVISRERIHTSDIDLWALVAR